MSSKRISEADIEEAFEDFIGESLPGEANASSLFIIGVTVLAAVAIFGIFVAGKRSGKLLSTVVEIKRS
ncbi:uncharacterized protein METZ01_LOCUS210312 [marine metagenome]|uniref:Uncharacterized protein n=1 Tax=marine metagenome TaxID=408172 RepID=A0A382F393_9ZZZZ|nr:hypothetical protein [Gammaproteobacteria bacterium]|tara:strand:- start:10640 stop:10846 length:207 start_codon:yes stop_codon:yes gene_type:complete